MRGGAPQGGHAPSAPARVWSVGALCQAVGDALDLRFNPVMVKGEISGFSRAASGHCYFSIKDASGQIRCAMFRRVASGLDFSPRDGDQVELGGRLTVYEARGDLQLVVESLRRAGQGSLFEEFLRRKARLEAEGLFAASRKRDLPRLPECIGVVTSLGAAALQDVATALRRRVPHVPVVLAPASVQGAGAPDELVAALESLYALCAVPGPSRPALILLVRGGGSMEDLWAFNDEGLVRCLARSPVPVVSGVGHETDFTLADFVADLRAPTPTAAAELCAEPVEVALAVLTQLAGALRRGSRQRLDLQGQRLDRLQLRLGRPSGLATAHRARLQHLDARLQAGRALYLARQRAQLAAQALRGQHAPERVLAAQRQRLDHLARQLALLDPRQVLARGYSLLRNAQGDVVTQAHALQAGQPLTAVLAEGEVDLTVTQIRAE